MKNVIVFLIALLTTVLSMNAQMAYEYTLIKYTGFDGTTFLNPTIFEDSADVPSIAMNSSGTMICAFQHWQGGPTSPSWDRVAVRISNDSGVVWSPPMTINITDLPSGSSRPFDPTIVFADSLWRLYFSSCPNGTTLNDSCKTHSAYSLDGINYTYEGPRFGVDSIPTIDPAVGFYEGSWYYSAPLGPPQNGAVLATSNNGLDFMHNQVIPSDIFRNRTGNLVNDGTNLRFYGGKPKVWWDSYSSTSALWDTTIHYTNVFGKDPGIIKVHEDSWILIVPTDTNLVITDIEEQNEPEISFYPNPFKHSTTISFNNGDSSFSLYVFDLIGNRLRTIENINSNKLMFERKDLIPGIYIIELRSANRIINGRFIIQ